MKALASAFPLLAALHSHGGAAEADVLLAPGDGRPEVHHASSQHPEGTFELTPGGAWLIAPPMRTEKGTNTMRIVIPIPADARKGDQLVLECSMRAVAVPGSAAGQAGLVLDLASAPFDPGKAPPSFFRHILLAGPDREVFRIPFEAPSDLTAGQ